jgi:hypothetical protein
MMRKPDMQKESSLLFSLEYTHDILQSASFFLVDCSRALLGLRRDYLCHPHHIIINNEKRTLRGMNVECAVFIFELIKLQKAQSLCALRNLHNAL